MSKQEESLLIECSAQNSSLFKLLRTYFNTLIQPLFIQSVATSNKISQHVFTWFKYYLLTTNLLGFKSDSAWEEFFHATLSHATTKVFQNDLPAVVATGLSQVSGYCPLKAENLFTLLDKCKNGKVGSSPLAMSFKILQKQNNSKLKQIPVVRDYLQALFDNSNKLLRKDFVTKGFLIRIFEGIVSSMNITFQYSDIVRDSVSLVNVFLQALSLEAPDAKERNKLGEILGFIIARIDRDAAIDANVFIRSALKECQDKLLFKIELNKYMQNCFFESKEKQAFLSNKGSINSLDCIDSLLKIDCDSSIKPLLDYQVALGNHFMMELTSIEFPPVSIVKNLFLLVEGNKEAVVQGKSVPQIVQKEIELESAMLNTAFIKLWDLYEGKHLKFLKDLCLFLNEIGVHSKDFIESRLSDFLMTDVRHSSFFFISNPLNFFLTVLPRWAPNLLEHIFTVGYHSSLLFSES